jgi:hypothetical protein
MSASAIPAGHDLATSSVGASKVRMSSSSNGDRRTGFG